MRVTVFQGGWPSHGEVLAHTSSRPVILEAWRDAVRSRKPDAQYYVFRAREFIRSGTELREALEVLQETWDGEVPSAGRRW